MITGPRIDNLAYLCGRHNNDGIHDYGIDKGTCENIGLYYVVFGHYQVVISSSLLLIVVVVQWSLNAPFR